MDKLLLQQQVLERLAEDLLEVEEAVRVAHEAATHEENIAENKYDTLGLEAAYLATGQARRAEAIRLRWPIGASSIRAPMTPIKAYKSVRWFAWLMQTISSSCCFSRSGRRQYEVGERGSPRSGHQQRSTFGQGHAG